jgi:hypothetical protein
MRQAGLPQHLALWMVLSCIVLFAAAVLAAGAASDRGVGRLRASMAVFGLAGKWAVIVRVSMVGSDQSCTWWHMVRRICMIVALGGSTFTKQHSICCG